MGGRQTSPVAPGAGTVYPGSSPGLLRRCYRAFRWVVLAVLVTVLFLILRTAPVPEVDEDPQAPRRLETKLQRLEAFGENAQALRLDEAELNSWMRSNLALDAAATDSTSGAGAGAVSSAGREAPSLDAETDLTVEQAQSNVTDVRVNLEGDQVSAYVLFNLYGKDLSLTLEGRLYAQDGYLRLDPTMVQLGSLKIPQASVDRAVRRLFESPENLDKFRLPPSVRDIRVENGQLVISYH